MTPRNPLLLALLVLAWLGLAASVALSQGVSPVANGDFEQEPTDVDPLPGWTVAVLEGGDALPASLLEATSKDRRTGQRALHLAGEYGTRAWLGASTALPARPGATYRFSAWTKTANLRREGTQLEGCSLLLTLHDATGAEVARSTILPDRPRERWTERTIELVAPPSVREARLLASLSMSGDFWVDDVELALEGGWDVPAAAPLLDDRFDRAFLGEHWDAEFEGQGRPSRARLEQDEDGAGRVAFTADADTGMWVGIRHPLPVGPFDTLFVSVQVLGESVGGAPPALRLAVQFHDASGLPLGEPWVAWSERGDGAWSTLSLVAVAPEGAAGADLSAGLRTPGRAWFDDVLVLHESGAAPPFLGWLSSEGEHLRVHMPPGHALERRLKLLPRDFERQLERLPGVALAGADPADVYLHADAASFLEITGHPAPHVDAPARAVHVLDEEQAPAALATLFGG